MGDVALDGEMDAVLEQASELLGYAPMCDLLRECYARPRDATFGGAFARLMTRLFAEHGLIVMDAAGRDFHALGAARCGTRLSMRRSWRRRCWRGRRSWSGGIPRAGAGETGRFAAVSGRARSMRESGRPCGDCRMAIGRRGGSPRRAIRPRNCSRFSTRRRSG